MNLLQKIFHKEGAKKLGKEPILTENKLRIGDNMSKEVQDESEEYEIVEKEILPEKMICPDCGGITLVGLDFCDKCGGELINHDN